MEARIGQVIRRAEQNVFDVHFLGLSARIRSLPLGPVDLSLNARERVRPAWKSIETPTALCETLLTSWLALAG